jgi:hypothetical protein
MLPSSLGDQFTLLKLFITKDNLWKLKLKFLQTILHWIKPLIVDLAALVKMAFYQERFLLSWVNHFTKNDDIDAHTKFDFELEAWSYDIRDKAKFLTRGSGAEIYLDI